MLCDLDNLVLPKTNATLSPVSHQNSRTTNAPLNILLVEDVLSDAMLTRIALNASRVPYELHTIQKGNEVLPCLREYQKRGRNALPDLIMLDLGLPCLDGFEILAELANAPAAIRGVPIIILTGHQHFEYVSKTYNLWIPAYINKPCSAEQIRSVLTRLHHDRPNGLQFH